MFKNSVTPSRLPNTGHDLILFADCDIDYLELSKYVTAQCIMLHFIQVMWWRLERFKMSKFHH